MNFGDLQPGDLVYFGPRTAVLVLGLRVGRPVIDRKTVQHKVVRTVEVSQLVLWGDGDTETVRRSYPRQRLLDNWLGAKKIIRRGEIIMVRETEL